MNKISMAQIGAGCGVAAMLLTGCGSDPGLVHDTSDTSKAVLMDNRMSPVIFQQTVANACQALVSSRQFQEFLRDYAEDADKNIKERAAQGEKITASMRRTGRRPLMMLSDIDMAQTGEHMDTRVLTNQIRDFLANQGVVRFSTYAAGAGQDIDRATAAARQLRHDPNIRKSTAAKKNHVNAYDLQLSGSIVKQRATQGRDNETSYLFTLVLTDTDSGEGMWSFTKEVKIRSKQPVFGW